MGNAKHGTIGYNFTIEYFVMLCYFGVPCSSLGLQILGSQQATRSRLPFPCSSMSGTLKNKPKLMNMGPWKCVAPVFLVTFWMKKTIHFGLPLAWPWEIWRLKAMGEGAGGIVQIWIFDDFSPENERSNPPLFHLEVLVSESWCFSLNVTLDPVARF